MLTILAQYPKEMPEMLRNLVFKDCFLTIYNSASVYRSEIQCQLHGFTGFLWTKSFWGDFFFFFPPSWKKNSQKRFWNLQSLLIEKILGKSSVEAVDFMHPGVKFGNQWEAKKKFFSGNDDSLSQKIQKMLFYLKLRLRISPQQQEVEKSMNDYTQAVEVACARAKAQLENNWVLEKNTLTGRVFNRKINPFLKGKMNQAEIDEVLAYIEWQRSYRSAAWSFFWKNSKKRYSKSTQKRAKIKSQAEWLAAGGNPLPPWVVAGNFKYLFLPYQNLKKFRLPKTENALFPLESPILIFESWVKLTPF